MADVIGISDVSSKDVGVGSNLKTGNLKRKYNMAEKKKVDKCPSGEVYSAKAKKCVKKESKKKPIEPMSDRESKVWGNYIRKGSLYNPTGQDSVVLDSLIRSKLRK